MTATEFSDQFDVLYNNITSNQAPGLTEYEKSVFLTKAQNEIVKNYFTASSKGNNIGQGFDDSAKRQADFSSLMETSSCGAGSNSNSTSKVYVFTPSGGSANMAYDITFTKDGAVFSMPAGTYSVSNNTTTVSGNTITITGLPASTGSLQVIANTITTGSIDPRSSVFAYPNNVFIVINERIGTSNNSVGINQVLPLRYDEYTRLMSKPFKRPAKNQAWRLISKGLNENKTVEIIPPPGVTPVSYTIRYIRKPKPIIIGNLDGLSIDKETEVQNPVCELDPILHEDILQRAVELAKVSWTATGQDNAQMVLQAGQRSE